MPLSLPWSSCCISCCVRDQGHCAEVVVRLRHLPGGVDLWYVPPDVHHLTQEFVDVVEVRVARRGADDIDGTRVFLRRKFFLAHQEQSGQAQQYPGAEQEHCAPMVQAVAEQAAIDPVQCREARIEPVCKTPLFAVGLEEA